MSSTHWPQMEDSIETIMSRQVHCVDADDDLLSAIKTMYSRRFSCVVATRNDRVCGILTERDVVRLTASRPNDLGAMKVGDAMTTSVVTIHPDTTLVEAARLMRNNRCRRFPVLAEDGQLLGVITQSDIVTGTKRALEQYSHRLEREVESRTQSLQVANEELIKLSVTDPLTGLYNRRFLFTHLKHEIARLSREGGHLACAMFDIDHFKNVNDDYGHECGDRVLVHLARTICDEIRPYDVAARYGGEEFILIMSADEPTATAVVERIRSKTANARFKQGRTDFGTTLSAGVVSRAFPSTDCDADGLIARADEAMYAAKHKGRDCTVRASQLSHAVSLWV